MIQQVNLYQDELRGARIPLSASLMAAVAGGLIVLLLAVYAAFQWQLLNGRKEAAALEITVNDKNQALQQLAAELKTRDKNRALAAQVTRLGEELATKRRLLRVVSGQTYGNTDGFSEYLAGLGRHRLDGLWLTEISVFGAGHELILKGSTLDARLLPTYLQALSAEATYIGKEFTSFWMTRPQEELARQLDFVIATRCEGREGEPLEGVDCSGREAS